MALHRLKGALMERMLEAEMTTHLGYEPNEAKGRNSGNTRNGHSSKKVQTESGPVEIRVPRDRQGSFEPQLIPKHRRRLDGFDDKVLALYSRGVSVRDIQGHLRELYGTDVSADLISRVTDAVLDEVRAWQARPLEAVYPIVYLDALLVSVRDGGSVTKKAVYIALGVGLDGSREVLGFWIDATEGARFWLAILTELKNRGVEDIFFVCCDGLTGLPQAIEAAFPKAVVQTCIVHLIRASLRYVTWAERKAVVAALRPCTRRKTSRPHNERWMLSPSAGAPSIRRSPGSGGSAGRRSCPSWLIRVRFGASCTRPTLSSR
jgi:putative transposase